MPSWGLDVEARLSVLELMIGVVGVRPSPALVGAVLRTVSPLLPAGTMYKIEGGFARVHTPQRDVAVSGLSPRWPIPRRWSKVMQTRTLTQALLSHVATLDKCPAQGARLSVRPSNEGITVELTSPADGQLLLRATLGWSEID
jgi:hypothetical protein